MNARNEGTAQLQFLLKRDSVDLNKKPIVGENPFYILSSSQLLSRHEVKVQVNIGVWESYRNFLKPLIFHISLHMGGVYGPLKLFLLVSVVLFASTE